MEQIETALQLEADGAGVDVDTLDAALDGFYGFETHDQNTAFDILDDIMASHSTNEDADLDRIDQLITWAFDTLDAP